jgi:hypothetical protein
MPIPRDLMMSCVPVSAMCQSSLQGRLDATKGSYRGMLLRRLRCVIVSVRQRTTRGKRSGPCMWPSRAFPVSAFRSRGEGEKEGRCGAARPPIRATARCCVWCVSPRARPAAVARGGQPPTAQTTRKRKKDTTFPLKVSATRDCIIAGLAWVYFCAPSYSPRPRVGRADCQCCPGLWIDRQTRRTSRRPREAGESRLPLLVSAVLLM